MNVLGEDKKKYFSPPCVTWSLELMSNIAGVEFVGNNLRGRNFCWVKCAKTLTSVVNTN